jgi:hypothetical protein
MFRNFLKNFKKQKIEKKSKNQTIGPQRDISRTHNALLFSEFGSFVEFNGPGNDFSRRPGIILKHFHRNISHQVTKFSN